MTKKNAAVAGELKPQAPEVKQINRNALQALEFAVAKMKEAEQIFVAQRDAILTQAAQIDGIDPKDGWKVNLEQMVWVKELPAKKE